MRSIVCLLLLAAAPALAATPLYRAGGNEPFWSLAIGAKSVTLTRPATPDVRYRIRRDQRTAAIRRVRAGPLDIRIERRLCRDSMSGMARPDTVTLALGGRPVEGCGGDPRATVTGAAWTVVSVDGRPLELPESTTLAFALDRITGDTGCNRFTAGYVLTGDGLAVNPAATTRRACPAAAEEQRFLSALAGATHFVPADDGSLTLEGTGGVIVALRER